MKKIILTSRLFQSKRAMIDKNPDKIGSSNIENNISQYRSSHDVKLAREKDRAGDDRRDEYSGACLIINQVSVFDMISVF